MTNGKVKSKTQKYKTTTPDGNPVTPRRTTILGTFIITSNAYGMKLKSYNKN